MNGTNSLLNLLMVRFMITSLTPMTMIPNHGPIWTKLNGIWTQNLRPNYPLI